MALDGSDLGRTPPTSHGPERAGGARRGRSRRRRRVAAIIGLGVALVLLAAGCVTVEDIRSNGAIVVLHSRMDNATDTGEVGALKKAAAGATINAGDLSNAIAFVQGENDGSDFRLVTLLRLRYAYGNRLDPGASAALRDLFLGVRYWMDEPGINPMVYWTENHQVLFATSELLAGQLYPADRFRDGRTGEEHRADARDRLLFWLEQRWRYGFSEWNSHYYNEDIAALSDLVDFAGDNEIKSKATIVTDLILLDIASHTFHGEFIATSGRLYEANRMQGDEGIRRIARHAFLGADEISAADGIDINFEMSGYRTPPVLAAIAQDTTATVVTRSAGRDLGELAADPSLTTDERRIMALWGMEAITNPAAIEASFDWIRAHGLLANPLLSQFRQLDYRVLRAVGALPVISRLLDLPTNGTILERANIYADRTPDFAMSTTQDYRPGGYGNQEAIFQLTLDPGVTIFHSDPAVLPGDPPPNGNSPGYWTGSGYLPLSCQDQGTNLSIYDLPDHPGYGRSSILDFTHLYVPLSKFDRVSLQGTRLFLQYRTALVAVTGAAPLRQVSDDEITQDGRQTFWVVEASSTRDETFEAFVGRVSGAAVSFDGKTLSYASKGRTLVASFGSGCTVDGEPINLPYGRLPSSYGAADGGGEYQIVFSGHSLVLDLDAGLRRIQ